MKLNIQELPGKLEFVLNFFKKYLSIIYILAILAIFGFFVFRINTYNRAEPAEDAIQDKLQTIRRPKIDKSVLDKIQQLQTQNVQVQSLFDQARSNPFNE